MTAAVDVATTGTAAPENEHALWQRRRAALNVAQLAPDLLEALGLKGYLGHDSERTGTGKVRPVWREGVGSPSEWPEDWRTA